jgi:ABC-2 type transport system ATP-binding protein
VIVQATNLVYAYGPRKALNGLTVSVEAGELFGILGPNGCGKSTLFRLLATLLPLQQGSATVAGADLRRQPQEARQHLGVVFQANSLDKRLTVRENMWAQGALYGLSGAALRQRSAELLAGFHLEDRADERAGALSGGLMRRLEIAKALLHRPRVLLLDEASAGLDPAARRDLFHLLDRLRREEGLTTLFTTHLMEEAEWAGRLLIVHAGQAVRCDSPGNLKAGLIGDVVVFHGPEAGLAARLQERFGAVVQETADAVRVEIAEGHRFLAAALDAFPACARGVEVHRPSLEDAFLHLTGVQFRG